MGFRKNALGSFAAEVVMIGSTLLFIPGVVNGGTAGDRETLVDAKECLDSEAFSLQGLIS